MARTAIPIQTIPGFGDGIASLTFTAADATNDHEFENAGDNYLLIKNDDVAGKQVDVVTPSSSRTANEVLTKSTTVPAGEIGIVGPFSAPVFNHAGGLVHVDITDETSLSFAVVKKTPST